MLVDYWRQLDIFDPSKCNIPVTIIGAGSLGSWITLFLAKSGITNITVYDKDIVDSHNPPNQVYGLADNSKVKVEALKERIFKDCGIEINAVNEFVSKETKLNPGILYMCTDTMSSRKEIWENIIKHNIGIQLFVETRLGAEIGKIYTINPLDPEHINKYEQTLYSDEGAEESPCTYRSIITVVTTIAALAAHKTIKYFNNSSFRSKVVIKEGGGYENSSAFCIRPLLITSTNF